MAEKIRCAWCAGDATYTKYHDTEWGRKVNSDKKLFEFLILESAQAGLSWITILRRREGYKKAFAGFDVGKVARFGAKDIERLMKDESIIRNRLKIMSAISNAKVFIDIQGQYGTFGKYLDTFFPKGAPIVNKRKSLAQIPPKTPLSEAISKDMKKRGITFFGPVTCYAYLQAVGYVDDHVSNCWVRKSKKL